MKHLVKINIPGKDSFYIDFGKIIVLESDESCHFDGEKERKVYNYYIKMKFGAADFSGDEHVERFGEDKEGRDQIYNKIKKYIENNFEIHNLDDTNEK